MTLALPSFRLKEFRAQGLVGYGLGFGVWGFRV